MSAAKLLPTLESQATDLTSSETLPQLFREELVSAIIGMVDRVVQEGEVRNAFFDKMLPTG